MSTTLEITFRCMCFFVPDEKTQRVYVLLPATSCGGTHAEAEAGRRSERGGVHGYAAGAAAKPVDPHVARITFPMPGGRLNDAGDTGVTDRQKDGMVEFLEMEGWSMVLPGTARGADLKLDEQIVDLSDITGGRVPRELFSGEQHPRIASLITLDGGRIKEAVPGAFWDFAGKEKIAIAQQVTWIVEDLPDGPLAWSRTRLKPAGQPLAEGDTKELPPLQPNKRGVIQLTVHHVMEPDFPKARENRTPELSTDHFGAHYGVLDRVRAKPLPEFKEKVDETRTIDCLTASGKPRGG